MENKDSRTVKIFLGIILIMAVAVIVCLGFLFDACSRGLNNR